MPGEESMFQGLDFREYEIAGNILRAWFDEDGLAFVVDETIDEHKPNVLLVVRPYGARKWDDLLQNVYDIDLETIRPKRDNKYQKLDVEYTGIDVYENLIRVYENHGDMSMALEGLIDFRDAAVRRAATLRLTTAQEEIAQAEATADKTEKTIDNLKEQLNILRDKLAQQKSYVGREPTKQSASRILRTEAQIESGEEKLDRAEKRLENAHRRKEAATEEVDAALALLALKRPSLDISEHSKYKVMDVKSRKDDVVKMPIEDDKSAQEVKEENEEPEGSEMPKNLDDSEEVKPLLDKDPEILDEEIAFKPVDFGDIKPMWQTEEPVQPVSPYDAGDKKDENEEDAEDDFPHKVEEEVKPVQQTEPVRPISPYAAEDEEPRPTVVHDDGDKEEEPFGFPDDDSESDNNDAYMYDDYKDHDKHDDNDSEKAEEEVPVEPVIEPKIDFEDTYSSKSLPEYSDTEALSEASAEEKKFDFEDDDRHADAELHSYKEPELVPIPLEGPVMDSIKSVAESEPSDIDNTGQVSTEQYDNVAIEAPSRPFSPVEVPKMPIEETRPMSPRYASEKPRPVGEKRSGFAYYILLILLIALSIFTLWLYQKKNGGAVPIIGSEPPVEEPIEPSPEPLPIDPIELEPPVAPVWPEPTPVDKPIEVRYPNDDVLRGPEPDVPVVESEEDVLARKQPYGVSRDDIPVVEPVIEEPVVQVTTVTLPDVIVEENVVSVPMPLEGEDVETVVTYNNPANVEYVEESYVVQQQPQYVPQLQPDECAYDFSCEEFCKFNYECPQCPPCNEYVPRPQYNTVESYNYVEEREPVNETRRDFTIHDGGQYSITETVTYHAN